MIYLAWNRPEYGSRELVYNGTDENSARAAVIDAAIIRWYPPIEAVPEHTISAEEYRRRRSMTTSDFAIVGSTTNTLDSEDRVTIPATPARPGILDVYSYGEIWAVHPNGDIYVSELELADDTIETPTWAWTDWTLHGDDQ